MGETQRKAGVTPRKASVNEPLINRSIASTQNFQGLIQRKTSVMLP